MPSSSTMGGRALAAAVGMAVCVAVCLPGARGIDNGLGITPPMGWRSWNAYHGNVNQDLMILAAEAMVNKSRGVSLQDAGFWTVGLDDNYQACGKGAGGSFHDASGYPIISTDRFPSMKTMTDKIHSLGLKAGWYANNCICNEHQNIPSWGAPVTPGKTDGINHYKGEVKATIDFGFDGIKLDGCGEFRNLSMFAKLFNETGKPILIEDCHWGGDGPDVYGPGWCPFNFFRTSGDIGPSWESVMRNLHTTIKWQPWSAGIGGAKTGPGCWPYPDMLEVGNLASFEEDRSHFGAWCIVSSPLILGHDLNNSAINDRIWPIVTNKHAIQVSQSYAGHPGSLVKSISNASSSGNYLWGVKPDGSDPTQKGWAFSSPGPIKYGGKCIDMAAGSSQSEVQLADCSLASKTQQFTLESTGELHVTGDQGLCLAIKSLDGPGVVSYKCNTGTNEEFVADAKATTICSKNGYCLAARTSAPSGSGSGDYEVWAKPQPEGAVAVLVINNNGAEAPVTFEFADFNFTKPTAAVFDVWNQKAMGSSSGPFKTDAIALHDSRFYLFSP